MCASREDEGLVQVLRGDDRGCPGINQNPTSAMLHDKLDDPSYALSFSGRLLQPEDVAAAVRKVLDRPRPATLVPGSAACRCASVAVRGFGLRALPLMVTRGRRVQRRMLARSRLGD